MVMAPTDPGNDELDYRRTARGDLRFWGMFGVGAVFLYAGLTIDPLANCSDGGECAPWLVPVAAVMGGLFGLAGLGQLLANQERGSRIDHESGELCWWQNRTRTAPGDTGRIALQDISRIRIDRRDEGLDGVHLYDQAGTRQPYFDEEVIPANSERWARALAARYGHIQIEIA